jgi:2-polyprenyl-3-methyl-5-hydroxy-6-metoxy-1,4-benzoquinol methylase
MEALVSRLGHEDTPRVYNDKNALVRELFWRRLDALLAQSRAPSKQRALDFGGGNGVLLLTLSRLYDEVVCVDLRTEMAEEIARDEGVTNARILSGDLASFNLPADSVDTILAADVLEHIIDLKALISEFRRLLRPGGELLVSAPSENAFYEFGRKVFRYVKPDDHYHTAAFIERTITEDLRLASRRYFPFNLAPLAVFSLARFVKPGAEGRAT